MSRAVSKWVGVSVIVRRGDLWLLHERRDGAGCDSGLWGAPGGVVERGDLVAEPSSHDTEVEAALAETGRDPGLARLRRLAKAEGLLP